MDILAQYVCAIITIINRVLLIEEALIILSLTSDNSLHLSGGLCRVLAQACPILWPMWVCPSRLSVNEHVS